MNKKTVRDIDVTRKRVLVRADLNVPFAPDTTTITDDGRIRAALPTVHYLRERGARIILCSHLGRPSGKVVDGLSLKPVAERLEQLLGQPVAYTLDCIGTEVEEAIAALNPGQLLLLENLRFHKEEEENDAAFARALASLAEVYVNDAFGTAHRAHASTEGVAHYMPAVVGLLMEQEIEMLGSNLEHPRRPLCAVMGGAKVSDKLGVLEHLLPRVDGLLIGGGMAATFLRALGHRVGASLLEEDKMDLAAGILHKAEGLGISFGLPQDVVVAEIFSAESPSKVVSVNQIPDGWHIMDIGPLTVESFRERLRECRTILWNGPLGVMEYKRFAEGTTAIADLLANLTDATTIIGGGSTAEAVAVMGLADRMTHVSTGGGASLEFLEGRELPGIAALLDKEVA